jgi:serine/threonine protein kinase
MTETITIPGYSIARKLGQGGMASVYLATQHSFERDVALKVMSPLLNSDPSFAARFKREARIVAQLSHASIVPVFDVGEHQSCHYLSMEYLSGGDLKHRLLQGEHDLSLALNVCIALSAALDVAHRKGFIHRDIKPENILFREDGTPVLTDFGIARALDSGRSMTLAGMLVGTPDYMSPEQVKGLELDGRSDLYSLGIVFFEIVTGSVPFKADSNLSVALKQLGEPLPALPPEYAAYQEFLDCLTAKDREQRFASGAEVVRALRVIGPERAVRNRALARSGTLPGVSQTRPSMVQAGAAILPTPRPDPQAYASQPTLAWPRAGSAAQSTHAPAGMGPPGATGGFQTADQPRVTGAPHVTSPPPVGGSLAGVTSPPGVATSLPIGASSPPVAQMSLTGRASSPPAGVTSPPVFASGQPAAVTSPAVASPTQTPEATQHSTVPPAGGGRPGIPDWIGNLARRSQPVWMGAAALAALVIGLTLIIGSFRKAGSASSAPTAAASAGSTTAMPGQSTSAVAATGGQAAAPANGAQTQRAATTTAAMQTQQVVAAAVAGQTQLPAAPLGGAQAQQAVRTTPAPANAGPANTPASGLPAPTSAQGVAQGPGTVASTKSAAEAGQAQAETSARRKRLLEERRQRKAEEAQKLAEEAAAVQAAQQKEQESHIVALLAAAKSEYAAGALWQPAGANAADHYREVLKMQPDRAEALAGAHRVANVLAAEAAQTESIGDVYNSGLLIAQVQSLQPDHPKLSDLQAKLQQMQSNPTSPDSLARSRLDRAEKVIAKAEEDLGHTPLDYRAVDDATDQYDRAVSIASTAPGLPSLRERLVSAYAVAVTTEINNHDTKRAHKLINTARKRKWTSDELDQLEASLQAAEAPPTATIKEAGANGGSAH